MSKSSSITKLWPIFAIFLASLEPVLVKAGLINIQSASTIIALKFIFGGGLYLLVGGRKRLSFKKLKISFIPAIQLYTTGLLIITGLSYAKASHVVMVMTITPLAVSLINILRRKESFNINFLLGFGTAYTGVLLATGVFKTELTLSITGFLILFAAMLNSAIYRVNIERRKTKISSSDLSYGIFLINLVFGITFLAISNHSVSSNEVLVGGFIGLFAALANFAFLAAISRFGATKMSLIDLLQRPLVIACAGLFLGEHLSTAEIFGIFLVILGIILTKKITYKSLIASSNSSNASTSRT